MAAITTVLGLLLALISVVLFFAVLVGVLVKGPARWVKISAAVLIVCFAGAFALLAGPGSVVFLAPALVFPLVLMAVAAIVHRLPDRMVCAPATANDCPGHARRKVDGWTAELSALGFAHHSDAWHRWKSFGSERRTYVRFLGHAEQPWWIELHAIERPPAVARVISSRDGEGFSLKTIDTQADEELFGDQLSELHRHPRSTSCHELQRLHWQHAYDAGRSFQTEADPQAASIELYDAWVARLRNAGELVAKEDGWVGVPLAKVPEMVVKVVGAWFH